MQVFLSIIRGMGKVLKYWNVILLFLVGQLLISWLLTLPMSTTFSEAWNTSMLPEQLETQGFTPQLAFSEVLISAAGEYRYFYSMPMLFSAALLYLLYSMFLLAGSLPLYGGLDLKFNWERFLSDGARFFRPFLILALLSVFFFWLADLLASSVAELVYDSLAESNDEATLFFSGLIFTTLFRFLLFSLVVMLFQYAKIAGAVEQLRNVIYLLRRAFSFISTHFLQVLTVFSILTGLDVLVHMLDKMVWYYMVPADSFAVQATWLITSSILLIIVKLLFFAAQVQLYSETRRQENEASSIKEVRSANRYSEVV